MASAADDVRTRYYCVFDLFAGGVRAGDLDTMPPASSYGMTC